MIVHGRLNPEHVCLESILDELQPFLDRRTPSGYGSHGNTIYKMEFVDSEQPEWIVSGEDPRYGDAYTMAHPMPPSLKIIKDLLTNLLLENRKQLSDTFQAEFAAERGEMAFLQVSIPLEFGNVLSAEQLRSSAAGDVRETYSKHIDKPALFAGGANYITSLTICGSACISVWKGREQGIYPVEALDWYSISKDTPHAVESTRNRIALIFRPCVLAPRRIGDETTLTNVSSLERQNRRLGKRPAEVTPKRRTKKAQASPAEAESKSG